MNTPTPDGEIRAAKDANRVLGDPAFQKAFTGIESALIDRMRSVPMADMATQHELILSLQLLGNIRRHFETMIQTGKMAEIQKEQSIAQKIRAFGRK